MGQRRRYRRRSVARGSRERTSADVVSAERSAVIRLRGPARRGGRRGEGRRCRLSQSKGAWLVCVVGRRVVPAAAGSRVHDHVTTPGPVAVRFVRTERDLPKHVEFNRVARRPLSAVTGSFPVPARSRRAACFKNQYHINEKGQRAGGRVPASSRREIPEPNLVHAACCTHTLH